MQLLFDNRHIPELIPALEKSVQFKLTEKGVISDTERSRE